MIKGIFLVSDAVEEMAYTAMNYLKSKELQAEFCQNLKHAVEIIFPIQKMLKGLLGCYELLVQNKSQLFDSDIKVNLS